MTRIMSLIGMFISGHAGANVFDRGFRQKRLSSELKAIMVLSREHLARRKAGLRFDRCER